MVEKFDLKDRKLLYELDINSRQSFGQLARKIGLSKNTVSYRIQNLQKEGIIKQFHTIINVSNLGYSVFRLYINLCNTNPEKEKEIVDFFKKKKIVTWMVSTEGEYNLAILLVVKNVSEMYGLWDDFIDKYMNYFDDRLLTLLTHSNYFPKAYLANLKKNNLHIEMLGEPKNVKVQSKDLEILKILSGNSRAQIIDIAEKLKLNSKTVMNRIRYLEKNGIISGYKTVFDLTKLGYVSYKIGFTLLRASKADLGHFVTYCKENPNIVYEEMAIGGNDIEIEVQVKNSRELREILGDIRTEYSSIIHDYRILDIYEKHKSVFLPVD
jgi:Lrp/AsnC family transcriptional regulator, leucine-responsive regulatory protein